MRGHAGRLSDKTIDESFNVLVGLMNDGMVERADRGPSTFRHTELGT